MFVSLVQNAGGKRNFVALNPADPSTNSSLRPCLPSCLLLGKIRNQVLTALGVGVLAA
jgi:hypothetical protein